MAYTAAQWARLQAGLPPEDKTSYADYLASLNKKDPSDVKLSTQAAAATPKTTATPASPTTQTDEQTRIQTQRALTKLTSGQTLTDAEKKLLNISTTPAVTPTATGKTVKSTSYKGTGANRVKVTTYSDDSTSEEPAPESGGKTQQLPAGFTPGAFPSELAKFFGEPPADIMGWKITSYVNAEGQTYYKLSISQKGAYGDAVSGSSEFGAPLAKDASGKWVVFQGDYSSSGGKVDGNGNKTDGSGSSSAEIASLKAQLAAIQNQNTAAANIAAANAAKEAESKRQSIIAVLTDRFNKYGLGSLVTKIRDLAVDGATEATITLALQETPEYQRRFAANAERLKKNLQVLTPAEYLNLEDGYRQVLRAYGLKQFDTDEYVRQFISNDVSAAELSDRVVTAVQRVQNADPSVSKQLRDYYGIGNADLVAYVLDPNQQLPKIQRQVAAAEIGAAAAVQGITAGVSVAEQLAAQGVTQAEARKGYATIADILPTAEKLSAIYGGVEAGYGLGEAEQEVFNSLAEAQRKRERLTSREIAAFSGRTGIARTGLTQTTQGQF
jgi:hypothetical protein